MLTQCWPDVGSPSATPAQQHINTSLPLHVGKRLGLVQGFLCCEGVVHCVLTTGTYVPRKHHADYRDRGNWGYN